MDLHVGEAGMDDASGRLTEGNPHSSHHMHHESTLLRETGRILRHRVSAETRVAVRESTEQIEKDLKTHNMKLRSKFEKRFLEKIQNLERHRAKGVKYWVKKTERSPYHVNLLKADTELNNKIQAVRDEFKRMDTNYERIHNMSGKPKYPIVTPDVLQRASSPVAKLALERRIIQGDLSTVSKEYESLNGMIVDEFLELERKFPKLRDKLMAVRESEDGSSTIPSSRQQSRRNIQSSLSGQREANIGLVANPSGKFSANEIGDFDSMYDSTLASLQDDSVRVGNRNSTMKTR